MFSHYKSKYRSQKKYKLVNDLPEDYCLQYQKNQENILHAQRKKESKTLNGFDKLPAQANFPLNSEPYSPKKSTKKVKFIRFQRNLHSSVKNPQKSKEPIFKESRRKTESNKFKQNKQILGNKKRTQTQRRVKTKEKFLEKSETMRYTPDASQPLKEPLYVEIVANFIKSKKKIKWNDQITKSLLTDKEKKFEQKFNFYSKKRYENEAESKIINKKQAKSVEVPQKKEEKNYLNRWDFHDDDDGLLL